MDKDHIYKKWVLDVTSNDIGSLLVEDSVVCLDLETFGLVPEEGIILQIGGHHMRYSTFENMGSFAEYVRLTPELMDRLECEVLSDCEPGHESVHWMLMYGHYLGSFIKSSGRKKTVIRERPDGVSHFKYTYEVPVKMEPQDLPEFKKKVGDLRTEGDILQDFFYNFLDKSETKIIVGHNIYDFDRVFLNKRCTLLGMDRTLGDNYHYVDTMWVCRFNIVPALLYLKDLHNELGTSVLLRLSKDGRISSSQDDLRKIFCPSVGGVSHSAEVDAEVSLHLLKGFQGFYVHFADILNGSTDYLNLVRMMYGKHKGDGFNY